MSLLGTLLRPHSAHSRSTAIATATSTAATQACSSRRLSEYRRGRYISLDDTSERRSGDALRRNARLEDVFIQSLVTASTCKDCTPRASTVSTHTKRPLQRDDSVSRHAVRPHSRRHLSTTRPAAQTAVAIPQPSREEITREHYHDLVDTYGPDSRGKKEGNITPVHYPLAPRLLIPPEQEEYSPTKKRVVHPPINEEHRAKIATFKRKMKQAPGKLIRTVWNRFEDLPQPRLRYLEDRIVLKLFRHFAWLPMRDFHISQQYVALLDEALRERVPLDAAHWNTAISMVGRWVQHTSSEEVKAAIEMWLRMEREGGVSANNVTFNILFDLAVKAERFALADTIMGEMERRGLELNRYFRTSKIYYAGKRGNGDAVRAAFRELVAAGEIVDTTIMNCVVVSLVRSDEIASAEHVLAKMIQLHQQKHGTDSLQDWREKKILGRHLDYKARQFREQNSEHLGTFFGSPYSNEEEKEALQRAAPIAPDELTYRILIQWHARASGNLEKIQDFIDAIKAKGWKVKYSVYYQLFLGFFRHGGYGYTAWNRKALEAYWKEFVDVIASDASEDAVTTRMNARIEDALVSAADVAHQEPASYFDLGVEESDLVDNDSEDEYTPPHLAAMRYRPATVISALVAFYKCAGARRMLEVWDEVQSRWTEMSEHDRQRIDDIVTKKCREAAAYIDP